MLVLLQKDAHVGLHNHPYQHGFIRCFRGSVVVEAFDEQEEGPQDALLKRVLYSRLNTGDSSFLTPDSRNIHRLVGVEKSHLIDIFIPPLQEENSHLCRRYENPHLELGEGLCEARIIPPTL